MFDVAAFIIDFGTTSALYLAVSLSLNLEAGFAGVPNFGKVMFVAAGAAIAGSVCGQLSALVLGVDTHGNYNGLIPKLLPQINLGLSHNVLLSLGLLSLGIVLAAGVGAGMGFLASYPAIRLREDYLGMLLLAAAQLFQIFLGGYSPLIYGTLGIEVPDVFGWVPGGGGLRDAVILLFLIAFAFLVFFYVEKVARSPLGRTLRAVRDNETAARALGKNDVTIRRNVIIVASAISAIAGALLTFYVGSVGSDTWTRVTWTFWIWVMVIIGGAANNNGVVLGALSFTFIFKVVDQIKSNFQGFIPVDVNWIRYLMFAGLLILILAYRPGGIIPEKSTTTLPWRTIAQIVQSESRTAGDVAKKEISSEENPGGTDKPG